MGDLSPQAQAKLLRFLENGEFYRVGSSQKRHIRTRIVSATNKDLSAMMDEGTFRHDLYFRLGVVTVHIPSLNERREDVIPLAQHFLVLYSAKYHKQFTSISKEAVKALQEHHWVGNVRELRNIIERGVLIGRGPELKLEDMGMSMGGRTETGGRAAGEIFPDEEPLIPPEGFDLMKAIEEYERRYIKAALKYAEGNESRAARLLHICLLYTSPSPRDRTRSRMPSSA